MTWRLWKAREENKLILKFEFRSERARGWIPARNSRNTLRHLSFNGRKVVFLLDGWGGHVGIVGPADTIMDLLYDWASFLTRLETSVERNGCDLYPR